VTPFPLQAVLDVRKSREERLLMEFVEETRRLTEETNRLHLLRREMDGALDRLRNLKEKTVGAPEMEMRLIHIRDCRRRVREQESAVDLREREVRERREGLLAAMKERKVVEILRDRHVAEGKKNEEAREQAAQDERAVIRSRRKKA
jgi:flagellar FliJ protein